jgi:hypothetical protein
LDERIIEMTWRCSTCARDNLGRHKLCQGCGHPKDASEAYEMPSNPEAATSVTEAALVRMASAGPDWRCAYCGSDQRRLDQSCANCGAALATGTEVPDAVASPPPTPRSRRKLVRNLALGLGVTSAFAGGFVWNARRPRDYDAVVTAVEWEHVIEVDRYAIRARTGFREHIIPGALEITSTGPQVHHHDTVFDHHETERYTVQVPDGYRTEHYTARESCGQDCTTTPRTCRQSCTSKKNGFASCKQVCTGGNRSCSTRYCNVSKTRQVAKTRSEWRSRQVSKYRQEPRYAEGFAWKVWAWEPDRVVRETGSDATKLVWPAGSRTALAGGEQERERRRYRYVVALTYDEDHTVRFEVANETQLAGFATGTRHEVHREPGIFTVDGSPISPLE